MWAEVVHGRAEHVEPIAIGLRDADAKEVWLSSRKTPQQAVMESYEMSLYTWTIMTHEKPIGMFGLAASSLLGDTGIPWLLGTDDMLKIRRQFIRESKEHVDFMLTVFPKLTNLVHVENKASIRWLKSVGFVLKDAVPAGQFAALFYPFERLADV